MENNQEKGLAKISEKWQPDSLAILKGVAENGVEPRSYVMGLTIEKAIQGTALAMLKKEHGEVVIGSVLAKMLRRTINSLQASNKLSEEDIFDVVDIMMQEHPTLTLEDFSLIFKRARTGYYGRDYNRIDGPVIFEWLKVHEKEVATARERAHDRIKEASQVVGVRTGVTGVSAALKLILEGAQQRGVDLMKVINRTPPPKPREREEIKTIDRYREQWKDQPTEALRMMYEDLVNSKSPNVRSVAKVIYQLIKEREEAGNEND